jgi:hypothetical protein
MKNKLRLYSARDERRVLKIHQELDADPKQFFAGASAILQRYRKLYPNDKLLSLRFIGRTLAKYGLVTKPKVRRKGVSRYLHYPEQTINSLGSSLLEIDFIGKKFIAGRTQPVNFIAFSLRFPRKLKHFQRIQSETAQEVIKHSQAFFGRFERPAVVKLDNGFAFTGAGPWPRTLNSVVLFLLKEKIVPVFIAPRKPWNQASVEGANSVFARKFWHRFHFRSLQEIDEKLPSFNEAYERYLEYQKPKKPAPKPRRFVPRVYFIRKIYETPDSKRGYIDILKEHISVPKAYIGMFILAEWNLKTETLIIYFENNQQARILKTLPFALNLAVKAKVA